MDFKPIRQGAEWIHLNQDTDQWKASVNAFISLRVALKTISSFSLMTLLILVA